MSRRAVLAAAVALLLTNGSPVRAFQESVAEFPISESQVLSLVQTGRRAKDAARRIATGQNDSETVQLLMEVRRYDAALKVLRTIVDEHPERIASALNGVGVEARLMLSDAARPYGESLRAIAADARRQIARLPRERAAEAARALVGIDTELTGNPGTWRSYLATFASEYAGTEAALLAQVDLLADRSGPQKNEALDAFAAAHPGTTAAAKALYVKGSDLAYNAFSFGERAGHDPTDRFFRVVAVVKELRSGRYPSSTWVDKAEDLILRFSTYQPAFAPGNAERVLAVLEEELPAILQRSERAPSHDGVVFVIGYRMGELLKLRGDALAGVEAVFDRLERASKNTEAVRLLRAEFYVRPSGPAFERIDRAVLREKAAATLQPLVDNANGLVQRKALATLARLRFDERKYDAARDLFRRYADTYPDAAYAWVAALRRGQCEESLGNVKAAVDAYRKASDRFRAIPPANVLGRAYAARAAEADGDFSRALADYQAASSAWDPDYGPNYSLFATREATPGEPFILVDDARVTADGLSARIEELKRSVATPGGALVERGRWFVARGRWRDAETPLIGFISKHGKSPLLVEARTLLHRARLEQALDLADADRGTTDIDDAVAALKQLSNEPPDFVVAAAKIALATIAALRAAPEDPNAIMADALRTWRSLDAPPANAKGDLERDVVRIRNVVFRPSGDGVFAAATRGWNAFRWTESKAPYVVVDPELRVKLADGTQTTIAVRDAFPEMANVLFLDGDRRAVLERVMLRLGGSKRRPWTQVMQTPNQPAGASLDVLALWQRSFWAQPGHWGGWVFLTYPIINDIEFVDAARTKAAVRVTVGYSGATVQLEKNGDVWIARALTNFWIT